MSDLPLSLTRYTKPRLEWHSARALAGPSDCASIRVISIALTAKRSLQHEAALCDREYGHTAHKAAAINFDAIVIAGIDRGSRATPGARFGTRQNPDKGRMSSNTVFPVQAAPSGHVLQCHSFGTLRFTAR